MGRQNSCKEYNEEESKGTITLTASNQTWMETHKEQKEKEIMIRDDIIHNIDIAASDDTIAFFGIVLNVRSLLKSEEFFTTSESSIPMPNRSGERYDEIVPTYIELDNGLTKEQLYKLAEALSFLAKRVRETASQHV